jgi:hypothetical protein
VWFGAAAGIGVSIIFGAIFAGIFYAAKTLLFQGTAKAIFQVRPAALGSARTARGSRAPHAHCRAGRLRTAQRQLLYKRA